MCASSTSEGAVGGVRPVTPVANAGRHETQKDTACQDVTTTGRGIGHRRGCLGFIEPIEIQEEMERSFLEYSMSVIVSRALPDVRDGLKPVHRRILYSMYDQRLLPDRPHTKCAKVVGDVMGSYHPHGDSSIYEALARMVQEFSHAPPSGRRPRQLRRHRTGRGSGGHALHGVPARLPGPRTDVRDRPGDGRLHRQLRRHVRRADGPAGALPEHPGQRIAGHRRGHGHQHPAPQPGRGHRRHGAPARAPRCHARTT